MRVIFAALVLSGLLTSTAGACSCAFATPEEVFGVSTAVFAGQVVAIRDTTQKNWLGRKVRELGVIATIRVELAWKGVSERQVVQLFVPPGGGECGFRLNIGELWLIYAAPVQLLQEMLQTTICARPSRLDPKGEDFLWLRGLRAEMERAPQGAR
jgi:hypothetical protein